MNAEYHAELRRRANANLALTPAQRRAHGRQAKDRARERVAAAERTRKAHIAYLKLERDDLRAKLADVPAMIEDARQGSLGSDDPDAVQGMLEEIESMREQWQARLWRVEADLRRAGR